MTEEFSNNHKLERFWQILFPFLISILVVVFIGSVIFSEVKTDNQVLRSWADISFALIILPILGAGVLIVLFFSYLIILIGSIRSHTHELFRSTREIIQKFTKIPLKLSAFILKPFIVFDLIYRVFYSYLPKGKKDGRKEK